MYDCVSQLSTRDCMMYLFSKLCVNYCFAEVGQFLMISVKRISGYDKTQVIRRE